MKNYLMEAIKYQTSLGISDIVDFVPNRKIEIKATSSSTENKIDTKQIKIDNADKKTHNKKEDRVLKNVTTSINASSIDEIKDILIAEKSKELFEIKRFSKQIVLGDGEINSKILVIGEAPGEEEDESGIPFCGKSGTLLMTALKAVGLERGKNFFVTNTVFWRPVNNRKPHEIEISACKPYLNKMIELINPSIIITVGSVSTNAILEIESPISKLIGNIQEKEFTLDNGNKRIEIFPIYHPSFLLRSPANKKILWKNLLTLKAHLIHKYSYDI